MALLLPFPPLTFYYQVLSHVSGGPGFAAAIRSWLATLCWLCYQCCPYSCTDMSPLLLFYLTLLLPRLTRTQLPCELKVIGEDEWTTSAFFGGCFRNSDLQKRKPASSFEKHDFDQNKHTYELNWAPLKKASNCVTKLDIFVNGNQVEEVSMKKKCHKRRWNGNFFWNFWFLNNFD